MSLLALLLIELLHHVLMSFLPSSSFRPLAWSLGLWVCMALPVIILIVRGSLYYMIGYSLLIIVVRPVFSTPSYQLLVSETGS